MELPSTIALSRLVAEERAMDVIANNLANANTTGFRTQRMLFSDWIARDPDPGLPAGARRVAFTQDRATWRELGEGNLSQTGNPFDLAIKGDAYFTVDTPAGPRLTRAGRFAAATDGTIVDIAGHKLLDPAGQPIQLAPGDTQIAVARDGTISGLGGQIGKVGLVTPEDPRRITEEGSDLIRADTPTAPASGSVIEQGMLEGSNVQPVLETTRMLQLMRSFEMVSQMVQTEADRQANAIDRILPRS
jgi:flagellar basal-body rod protein FlgF